jgi:hypothetical protein
VHAGQRWWDGFLIASVPLIWGSPGTSRAAPGIRLRHQFNPAFRD